ncbi:phosphodiester glycosidase family protein [Candidatus Saccharibacteria bacterium]|nr:phosphodiester glycosidase family protein [Candidatus Saccharibacteria bacterium]
MVAVVAVGLIGLATIEFQPSLVANFADNYLRPAIGNRATIALEASMLSLSDHLKQLAYGTIAKPNSNIFSTGPSQPATFPNPAALSPTVDATANLQALNLAPLNYFQPNFAKLPGEGNWSLVELPQFKGQSLMAKTFVRPDSARSYAIVALVQMNAHQLHLHSVAGTEHPGAILGHPGPGLIPASDIASNELVAGFNGGFQYKDGHYGMVVGPTTYVPLQTGLGTLTIYKDGSLMINRYQTPASSTKPIEAIRQNGPLILDNGTVTSDAISGGYAVWGRTTTNSIYTWRSGVGLTPNGNLIYAVGPSLTAATLASALKAGGATEAIQLDINAFWVRYVTFQPLGNGSYSYQSILNTLANGGYAYLHGYNKDFFYLTLNQPVAK